MRFAEHKEKVISNESNNLDKGIKQFSCPLICIRMERLCCFWCIFIRFHCIYMELHFMLGWTSSKLFPFVLSNETQYEQSVNCLQLWR